MNPRVRLEAVPVPMHQWQGAGNVTLSGDSWGNPAGPLVLLLHGGGQTRHAWKNSGRTLGDAGYHAVAVDARGHGDSSWATNAQYSPDIMVEDLRLLVAALGNRPPVLVGASMGGSTSLLAVGEQRVQATALVLVDVAPKLEIEGIRKVLGFMTDRPSGFQSLEEMAQAVSDYQPHRRRPSDLAGLVKNVRQTPDGRYHWHWDPTFLSLVGTLDLLSEEHTFRLRQSAATLKLPTLLVRGGMSDVLTEEGVHDFLALCPAAEYVNVRDAHHMVAGDSNDVFCSALMEFLARHVPVQPTARPSGD